MNSKEFLNAVQVLNKEKGIDEDTIYNAMELAMASAYKKHSGLENVRVDIDRKKGDIKIYSFVTVVSDDDFEVLKAVKFFVAYGRNYPLIRRECFRNYHEGMQP